MAGGGIKSGTTFGKTDDYVTILQKMESISMTYMPRFCTFGIDHERLTYKYRRHFRLTHVHGHVVSPICPDR